jgi:chromosome transmission fidelity protein 18
MSNYSPDIPSSFDPALLHSEIEFLQTALAQPSFSDDFDALQQCILEDRAKKTTDGIVIQHRAWNLADIFRSEGEHLIGTGSA